MVTVLAIDDTTTNGNGVTDLVTGVTASYATQDGGGVTNTGMMLTYIETPSTAISTYRNT